MGGSSIDVPQLYTFAAILSQARAASVLRVLEGSRGIGYGTATLISPSQPRVDDPLLRVAQIVSDTEAEGPGRRLAVWVQGCPLRCPGCCNPQMLSFSGGVPWTPAALARLVVETPGIEGLTLLGGEPVAQAAACAELATVARGAGLSVMLFSGYTIEELRRMSGHVRRLLDACDLLVDGRYEHAAPEVRRRWIGSRNQRLHVLTERYRADDPRFSQRNTIELRLARGELSANGWPSALDRLTEARP
jgi:anaerobic ribonucleoside-triphosphate reductase activating protein